MTKYLITGAALLALTTTPARAEVKTVTEQGFSTLHAADVLGTPEDVWKRLMAPKDWWNPAHSWSGSVEGFYIDPQAGGCFCELIQQKDAEGRLIPKGSVEHMRVIFAQPGKVLRMSGGLGPLQAEAVTGTLTIAMEPLKGGGGTRLSFSYVVGGYMRFKTADIAPAVDAVLREQFERMIKPLGKVIGNDSANAAPEEGAAPKSETPAKKEEDRPDLGAVVNAIEPEKSGKPQEVERAPDGGTPQPD